MTTSASSLAMTQPILYAPPLLVPDRPRTIDRVIDYFGDPPGTPHSAAATIAGRDSSP